MDNRISPTRLGAQVGISKAYACGILKGNKTPSEAVAVRIYRATGMKLGRLADLNDDQIAVLEAMHG